MVIVYLIVVITALRMVRRAFFIFQKEVELMEKFVSIFNSAMELSCLGLYEKLQNKSDQGDYRYSPLLKKALDKFSLLHITYSLFDEEGAPLLPIDEAALVYTFNFSIKELIDKLPGEYAGELCKTEWYTEESYITVGNDNRYYCMPELLDILNNDRIYRKANNSPFKELELTSQKFIQLVFERSQEEYCEIRTFLEKKDYVFITGRMFIEDENIRSFRNKYPEIFKAAYEKLNYTNATLKVCPHCGLILKEMDDDILYCVSERCTYKSKGFTNYEEFQVNGEEIWVLRLNVARYIYYPGILEQQIKEILEKSNIYPILWPDKDAWDFQFELNGKTWVIDAKDVKDPRTIQEDIRTKEEEGIPYDRAIYVVPSHKNENYLEVITRMIKDRQKVECLTLPAFSRLINEEVKK